MNEIKAANLLEGSIVANHDVVYLRVLDGIGAVWHGTNGSRMHDLQIGELLDAGAVVLRHGYGDEGER